MEKINATFKEYFAKGKGFGRVAVLLGGTSAERDISLLSGNAVLNALLEQGVDAIAVDVGENAVEQISALTFDRAFIALHGAGGEDGKIQALLDLLGKPYTGSKHTASAIAMDKLLTKAIWQSKGLPTPEYWVADEATPLADILKKLGGEVFVKPVHEGSSIGMRCVNSEQELHAALGFAGEYDKQVLVEKRVIGEEFSVAVLNGNALPPIRLKSNNRFYDYEAKYISEETQYLCPCGLDEEKEAHLKKLAEAAFSSIACRGWGRIDVMQDLSGEFYLLEANTVPGMTSHSLVPMAAKVAGLGFSELVCEILMGTIEN
ncbi:D-alanine--D-alanine ligase [Alteromonadaceae bacterium Bs31]|nr:D-alanine--D-alanine ligase [Alteromonadaceae bacterium Bs31]